jgi:hypothetical protein
VDHAQHRRLNFSMRLNPLRLTAIAVIALTVCALASSPGFAVPSAPSTRQTDVIIFHPRLPPGTKTTESGHCWTESIALDRPGAWRCMRENAIYDPCFELAGQQNRVVCGANPAKDENGFALALTQALPSRPAVRRPLHPWLIQLADGSTCEAAAGTMAVIDGEPVRYPCSGTTATGLDADRTYCGLLDTLSPAKVWTADRVCFTVTPSRQGPPFKLLKRERVTIHRLWQ